MTVNGSGDHSADDQVGHEILDGGVAVVTLRKPPANTMDPAMLEVLCDRLDQLAADDGIRSLVIAAEGKAFCAGVDLKAVVEYGRGDQQAMVNGINRLVRTVYGFRAPTVAAVAGHAIAGGLILVLCCDHRVGPKDTGLFGLAEVKAAVPFPFAAIEVARAELTPSAARTIILSGDNIGPDAALSRGIFDELQPTERVRTRAIERALELAALPPVAFNAIKRQLRGPTLDRIGRMMSNADDPMLEHWITDETKIAARAILAGRG